MLTAKSFAILALCTAPAFAQVQSGAALPPLPATGVDYSAIDQFYVVADILRRDEDPSDAQWQAFLATPGYRLLWQQNRNIRQQLAVAFKPSRKATRDSLLATPSDASLGIAHLVRAYEKRGAVLQTRAALERSLADSIALGVRAAAKYLPKGTVESRPTPFIGFAIFGDDGYALDGGVLLDPLYVMEEGIVDLLSHEFHHSYASSLDRTIRPSGGQPPYDVALAGAIRALRNEGIADQIDKPHPLPPRSGALAGYVSRYNEVYERTPVILKSIDSLLVVVADDSTKAGAAGTRARQLLWSNGHPNGAYIARQIVTTFGVDSLMPAIYNPFAMLRTYASAQVKRGNPPPFSPRALAKLADMEKRFIRP
jgi:hypothetical protein